MIILRPIMKDGVNFGDHRVQKKLFLDSCAQVVGITTICNLFGADRVTTAVLSNPRKAKKAIISYDMI